MSKVPSLQHARSALIADYQQAVAAFVRFCEFKGLTAGTIQFYREKLLMVARFAAAEGITPAETTTEHLHRFLLSRRCSAVTKNGYIRTLRAFFGWLYREEYLSANPAANLEKQREAYKLPSALNRQQVSTLLHTVNVPTYTGRRDYALYVLLLDTGLRVSEALGLDMADIDWREGTLVVMGKGSKQRTVPFGSTAKRALLKWLDIRGEIPGQEAIFVTWRGDRVLREHVRLQLHRQMTKAGIEGVKKGPHSLRHTFATEWLRGGGDLFVLQRILGHTTLEMTRRYVALLTDDMRQAHRQHSPMDRMMRR